MEKRVLTENSTTEHIRQPASFIKWLVIIGVVWGQIVLLVSTISEPNPENVTLFFAVEASGAYTVLLYYTRDRWMPWFSDRPFRGAVIIGSINAAIVETLFLLLEKLFSATGIAAHPNLLIDLALTMPWYIGMVYFFARVQERYQYSDAAVLLIGAMYELGADGILGGQLLPIIVGRVVNLSQSWVFLVTVAFWQFIPVYSSMLLPAAWLLQDIPETSIRKWLRWSRPMLWLVPYTVYLVSVMLFFFIPEG